MIITMDGTGIAVPNTHAKKKKQRHPRRIYMFNIFKKKELRVNGWQLTLDSTEEDTPVQECLIELKITLEELKIYKKIRERKDTATLYDITGEYKIVVASKLTVTADGEVIAEFKDCLLPYLSIAEPYLDYID